jgi:tyrosine-protein kinase Etk/Wzc
LNSEGKKEKTIVEILYILYRRKFVLISTVFVVLVIAALYSFLSKPTFESTVLLKKEMASDKEMSNEFYDIVKMQTQDEVETEMELVKTGEVLGKVVDELKLFLSYQKLETKDGLEIELDKNVVDYYNPKSQNKDLPFPLPEFSSIEVKENKKFASYYIKKDGPNEFGLYDPESDELLQSSEMENLKVDTSTVSYKKRLYSSVDSSTIDYKIERFANFSTSLADINVKWPHAPVGSKFYFKFNSYFGTIVNLGKRISISRRGKTNIFNVSIKASSPYSAAVLANLIIDKFRESRIEQRKQTIRYSFAFVDDQLEDMQLKLRLSEDNLSNFKSSGQITTIDASSQEVIKFLSSLEAEKLNTELKLNEYQNKIEDMKDQLESSGYFDQTFLTPDGSVSDNDPFSALLKQLSDLELKRLELLQKRTQNHPDVINLDEQIGLAKSNLASYNQNTLTAYTVIVNSLRKKLVNIANMMSKYEVKLERLPGQENKLARLIRQKDVYEKMFTLLLDKREEMRLAELSKLQDIIIVDPAKEPFKPISPKKMLNMIIGLFLGTFFGIVLIFLLELKNSKLVNLDEIEEEFQIPIFALIPAYSKKIRDKIKNATDSRNKFITLMDEQDGFRESFRLLKTKMRIHMEGRENIIMITSCEENTGKTTIVGNLAVSFAQENRRVLIIDCDLRKAQLSRMFGISRESTGLIEYLSRDVAPSIYTKVLKKIDILPAGGTREDSSHLLNSEKMKTLFNSIDTSVYDYIILDTPPVTRVVDTLVLGRYIKDAVLVVRPNLSYKEAVWGGILELIQAKIKIRGVIANGAEIKDSYYYRYRYGYGYGYSYGEEKASPEKKSKVVSGALPKTSLN